MVKPHASMTLAAVAAPLALALALGPVGCGGETRDGDPSRAQATVGAEGGSVALGPFTLEVPAGALAEPVEIALALSPEAPPAGYKALSPLLELEPESSRHLRCLRLPSGDASR